ncbi:MAG: DNA alkylation repair protein [Faecousia sp.]
MTETITEALFSMQDQEYRQFQCRLMPTVAPETVIGVRTPELRALAKKRKGDPRAEAFLSELPHRYYEENNLHAFLIEQIADYDACIRALERFLPFVDNWATCDMLRPKCFKRHLEELLQQIEVWLAAEHPFTVRFGIEMLMTYYLDEAFAPRYLELVAGVRREEYYVNMMCAWYFATALAKQWDSVIGYLEENRLPLWVHNKTIQKAVESYRIDNERKEYLRSLKRTERKRVRQ